MLAIASGKGGTGKTTATVELARAFGRRGRPTLAVDGDWDLPDLGALVGGPRRTAALDGGGAGPLDAAVPVDGTADGLLLPAPAAPDDVDPGRLFRAVAADPPAETAVLVDCPAGAASDAVAPLRAADGVLVVTEACAAAARDTAKTVAVARRLGTPVVGAVVSRATVAPPGLSALLGCRVLATVPRVDPPVVGSERIESTYDALATALAGTAAVPEKSRRIA